MIEEIDFETFLYVSKNKYQIFVFDKKKLVNLYSEELKINNDLNFKDFENLSEFLDENIYKIEKLVDHFIKDIILIIESEDSLYVDISINKKNYDQPINNKYLENNLIELKDLYKENYEGETIMHMIVKNYIINGKKFLLFESNLTINNLCLEVNFISISNEFRANLH